MWIETTIEVYYCIFMRHKKDFRVFWSFTDIDGISMSFSKWYPFVLTEWWFSGSETPIIKVEQKKEKESDKEWEYKYFIYCDNDADNTQFNF